MNTDDSTSKFYNIITKLLDEMAPYKKMTKKELTLKQNPWISPGIITSMKIRDQLHKEFLTEKNVAKKDEIHKKIQEIQKHNNISCS